MSVEVLGEAELLEERVARREEFRLLMFAFTSRSGIGVVVPTSVKR
jgi:hypothetical protein